MQKEFFLHFRYKLCNAKSSSTITEKIQKENHIMSKRLFISSLTAAFSAGTAFGLYIDHVITSDEICAIQTAKDFPHQNKNSADASNTPADRVEQQFHEDTPIASDSWPDKTVPEDEFSDRRWIYMPPKPGF
jgi:hypothetical protein